MYEISDRQRENAKSLGVEIKPSTLKNKKVDVFRKGEKIASIGGKGYKDYSSYLKTEGKQVADKRKELYKIRHANDLKVKGSAGFFANRILWA